jgi:hypothetical protein
MDMDHHADAINVADFQLHQLLASHAGAVKQQQPNAMQPVDSAESKLFCPASSSAKSEPGCSNTY